MYPDTGKGLRWAWFREGVSCTQTREGGSGGVPSVEVSLEGNLTCIHSRVRRKTTEKL